MSEALAGLGSRMILHVGCGRNRLPDFLAAARETRLDIDPDVEPDVVASMTELGEIGQFGAIYCSHALEHLAPHDVAVALREFHRVLETGGLAVITVPDLEDVRPTHDVVFIAPAGPVTGHDMYYGYGPALKDNPFMAHRSGFVAETLEEALNDAGFGNIFVRRIADHNLLGIAVKA